MKKKETIKSEAKIYALSDNDLQFGCLYLKAGQKEPITQDLASDMRESIFFSKGTLKIFMA